MVHTNPYPCPTFASGASSWVQRVENPYHPLKVALSQYMDSLNSDRRSPDDSDQALTAKEHMFYTTDTYFAGSRRYR